MYCLKNPVRDKLVRYHLLRDIHYSKRGGEGVEQFSTIQAL